jgi:hypothetical protein
MAKFELRRGDYQKIGQRLGVDNKRAWDLVNREENAQAMEIAAEIVEARKTAVDQAKKRLVNACSKQIPR